MRVVQRGGPYPSPMCRRHPRPGGVHTAVADRLERLRPMRHVPVVHLGLLLGATSTPSPRRCACLDRGDVPKHVTEANLLALFCEVATVDEVTIIKDKATKISREEILLENVELTLEAFDYLQLPFTLKDGRIGKLSIWIGEFDCNCNVVNSSGDDDNATSRNNNCGPGSTIPWCGDLSTFAMLP